MPDLQKIYNETKNALEEFDFIKHIRGRAGKLEEDSRSYRAFFIFSVIDSSKLRKLERYLTNQDKFYDSQLVIESFTPQGADFNSKVREQREELWKLLLVSRRGKPVDQENDLIKSLNYLKDYLEAFNTQTK